MLYYILHIWNNKQWIIDDDDFVTKIFTMTRYEYEQNTEHSKKWLHLRNKWSLLDHETETKKVVLRSRWSRDLNIPANDNRFNIPLVPHRSFHRRVFPQARNCFHNNKLSTVIRNTQSTNPKDEPSGHSCENTCKVNGLQQWTVHQYAFAKKAVGDLDIWMHDLQNSQSAFLTTYALLTSRSDQFNFVPDITKQALKPKLRPKLTIIPVRTAHTSLVSSCFNTSKEMSTYAPARR